MAVIVVVALVVLTGGSSYVLHLDFENASGLVDGNLVQIGPATVGHVNSIALTRAGAARVTVTLDGGVGPMHQGTVAHIYEDSLSGIANKYIALEPGPREAPTIPGGGEIGEQDTHSEVGLDELFDALDPLTRAGLRNLIRGEAASLAGRGADANRTLEYLAPGLESTSEVTAELTRDEPAFDGLIVQGAQAMQALAARSQQLSQLIANTDAATGAIADQSRALADALTLLPSTLRRSTTTFAGLDQTLDALSPLVAASKPAVRRLPQFAERLGTLLDRSVPTVSQLDGLIAGANGNGGLTELARQTPGLATVAAAAFPRMIDQFNVSQAQTDYLREYTPDLVAALSDVGQAGANYDANGHYFRVQPALEPFTLNSSGQLTMQFPSQRYQGLQAVRTRCPGGAVQPTPDGSAPTPVAGCDETSTPPGP